MARLYFLFSLSLALSDRRRACDARRSNELLFPSYIAIVLVVATVSFHWFEGPARNWMNRRFDWWRKQCILAPAASQLRIHISPQIHRHRRKNAFIHELEIGRDAGAERHVPQYVPLQVYAGRDLDQLERSANRFEDRALGNEDRGASLLHRERRAVADAFDPFDELFVLPLFDNLQRPIRARHLKAARRERAAKNHVPGVLTDIDEPADPDDFVSEAADVDAALAVDLDEGQKRQIEASAIVEVELVRLIHYGVVILCRSRIGARQWSATHEALLVGEHDPVDDTLFCRDRSDPRRYAGTEIADRARGEFHSCSAGHDLAMAEWKRLDGGQRASELARIARAAIRRVGLPLGRIDYNVIDDDPGNLDGARRQNTVLCDPLDLHDHDTASASGCLRHGQHFAGDRFLLHADVAVFIGRRAPQDRDVEFQGFEAQPLFAID